VLNGGLCFARSILNHQVSKDFNNPNPKKYLKNVAVRLGLPQPVVGLMTAVDVSKVSIKTESYREGKFVSVFVTAGLSNSVTVGENLNTLNSKAGTINLIVLVDGNLTDACLVEAVKTVTEAKTLALKKLDVRSSFSRRVATGTTTDAVAVACTGEGETIEYAGAATEFGRVLGLSVVEAVREATVKTENLVSDRSLAKRLEEIGITVNSLIEAIMELLVYHPDMGSKKEVLDVLGEELNKALNDVNVASLVLAGVRLEEDGENGLIPKMSSETFKTDPVFLLADEILGMSTANYIAGAKGIFEFARFDRVKPGIIKRLGPFLDDVIGGLIAGVSSNMYSRLLAKKGF